MASDDQNSQGFTVADESQYRSLQTVISFRTNKLNCCVFTGEETFPGLHSDMCDVR